VIDGRDVTKDFLPLRYDPAEVTPGRILEEVRKQGFEGAIVPAPNASAPDEPPDGGENR
jgi:hypothetical protein